MKNARKRNELRDRYNIIGLEMEAAGTMNCIPVGVIRGVCDYGDEHKSKQWQPYAAAMAACYAKAVLAKMPPKVVVRVEGQTIEDGEWKLHLLDFTDSNSELTCGCFKTHRVRYQVDQNAHWTTLPPPLEAESPSLPAMTIPIPHFHNLPPFNRNVLMRTELRLYCNR